MEKINKDFETRRSRTGFFGLLFILAGLILIGDQLELFSFRARDLIFTWQALLIVIGLAFLIKRDGKFTGIILILIGVFFMLPKFIEVPYDYMKLFWPSILVIIGIVILFRGLFNKSFGFSATNTIGDRIEDLNIFGGHDRIITNQNFNGGEIVNVFGGGKYNLLSSQLKPGKSELEVLMIFGGSKLIVPQDWEVKVEVAAVFGGFSDKRIIPSDGIKSQDKILVIKGVAIFGGGEIASFDN